MKRLLKPFAQCCLLLFLFLTLTSIAWGGTKDVVFLAFGDSITYGISSSSNGPETGYPILLERKLGTSFDARFISINAGSPGEDTFGGLNRFGDTLDLYRPDLVLLMEGTNDCLTNSHLPFIEPNLRSMIQIATDRGIPVIIATIPPVISNQYNDRSQQQANIQAFNPRIYSIAADYHIRVAQVYEAITSVPGWEGNLIDQLTANHPNDAGYEVVRDAFFEQVSYLINSGSFDLNTPFSPYDFNGDGKADILWQHARSGDLYLWLMDGTQVIGAGSLGTVDLNWKIRGLADFNGDGKADILWQHARSGDVYLWLMNGTQVIGAGSLGIVSDLNWKIKGLADFNGDGKADILWQQARSGDVYLWLMDGTQVIGAGSLGTVDLNWKIRGLADFNGDGKADILWQQARSGDVYLWLMDGTQVIGAGSLGIVDLNWKIRGLADFNGDGKADILWQQATDGELYLWLMDGTQGIGVGSLGTVDLNWKIRGLADFNGDGKADILWQHARSGDVYLWLMNGTQAIGVGSLGTVDLNWQIE